MRVFGLTLAAALTLAATAFCQPAEEGYAVMGPPPLVVTVVLLRPDRGDLICEEFYTTQVPVTKSVPVEKEGPRKEVPVTVFQAMTESRLLKYPLKDCEFHTAGGKKLGDEEARRRLTAGTTLLIAAGGKPTAHYLKLLRDDALILVTGAREAPRPPGTAPRPPDKKEGHPE